LIPQSIHFVRKWRRFRRFYHLFSDFFYLSHTTGLRYLQELTRVVQKLVLWRSLWSFWYTNRYISLENGEDFDNFINFFRFLLPQPYYRFTLSSKIGQSCAEFTCGHFDIQIGTFR
jgi:hypothetical protein